MGVPCGFLRSAVRSLPHGIFDCVTLSKVLWGFFVSPKRVDNGFFLCYTNFGKLCMIMRQFDVMLHNRKAVFYESYN